MNVRQLLGETTHGYEETREASFNDDGTLHALLITVTWDDGTHRKLFINLAGPPDYTFTQDGALDYPDGSRMKVVVPPDGTLRLIHDVYWASRGKLGDYEEASTTSIYRRDGSGSREFTSTGLRGDVEYAKNHYYDFDARGRFASEVRTYTFQTDAAGTHTDTIESVTLDGIKTVQTIVRDSHGQLISDTTVVTHVTPLIDTDDEELVITHNMVRVIREQRATEPPPDTTSSPRPWGPRKVPLTSGGGYPDGFQALPRIVGPDPVGKFGLCEHTTDYFIVDARTHEETYLGTRHRGFGPCY